MSEWRYLDGYRTVITHREKGGWDWEVGKTLRVGYDFERLDRPDAEGWTATRWGAKRQARKWIARQRRHEALTRKNLVIDEKIQSDEHADD